MSAFLFTLDPENWKGDDLTQAIYESEVGGGCRVKWTCASFKKIHTGDTVYLMLVGESLRGIMGSGVATSRPKEVLHWESLKAIDGITVHRVELYFDVLMDSPVLFDKELKESFPEYNWFPPSSGVQIPSEIAEQLSLKWGQVIKSLPIGQNKALLATKPSKAVSNSPNQQSERISDTIKNGSSAESVGKK